LCGWRLRVGLIVPSSNTTMEYEFWRLVPEGVSVHVARVRLVDVVLGELRRLKDLAVEAAVDLTTAGVDVIVFGCTSGSLIGGIEWEERLREGIEVKTGVKTVTTAQAVVKALKHLNVRKLSVATPYVDEVNELERRFLEENGFKVLKMKGLGIVKNVEIGKQPPQTALKLAEEVYTPEAEAIFISCTNFRTIEVIKTLEEKLKIPVISSNTASLWAALRVKGLKDRIEGYGKLLET